MLLIEQIESALHKFAEKERVAIMQKYFKTGPGEYAENDVFIGVRVPNQHKIAKEFYKLTTCKDLEKLLQSPIHEFRLTAGLILVLQYQKFKTLQTEICEFYLAHKMAFNNWDLVDSTAPKILGAETFAQKNTQILHELATSDYLWSQRIAMVATQYHIKQKKYAPTLHLAKYFLTHPHDLMHKACGWMLREVGEKDQMVLLSFLDENVLKMPRTMLRYAIEKLDASLRKSYLSRKKN